MHRTEGCVCVRASFSTTVVVSGFETAGVTLLMLPNIAMQPSPKSIL